MVTLIEAIVCLPMDFLPFWQNAVNVFLVQMCPLFSCCLCSFSSAHWERMTLLSRPIHWQAHLVWHYRSLWSEAMALFQVTRTADSQARTQLPRVAFCCCVAQMYGGAVKKRSGRKRSRGIRSGMTDGRMKRCRAGQTDSWNRLSVWLAEKEEPVRLLPCHHGYQVEQLAASLGEPHRLWYKVEVGHH